MMKSRVETPLHIVLALASECYLREQIFSLPAVVKLLVEAGGDVDNAGEFGRTPLMTLIREVRSLVSLPYK